jgi:hypothetical protein
MGGKRQQRQAAKAKQERWGFWLTYWGTFLGWAGFGYALMENHVYIASVLFAVALAQLIGGMWLVLGWPKSAKTAVSVLLLLGFVWLDRTWIIATVHTSRLGTPERELGTAWKPGVPTMSLSQQEMLTKRISSSQRAKITVFIEWGSEDLISIAQQFGGTLVQSGMDVDIKRGPSAGPLPSGVTVVIGQHANGLAMAIIATLRSSGVVDAVHKEVGTGGPDELTFIFVR